jgi:hypothetical protein
MHNTRRLLALATLSLALAACGDGGKTPVTPTAKALGPGELRFKYSGTRTGEFTAAGDPRKGARTSVAYAASHDVPLGETNMVIVAWKDTSDPQYYDDIVLDIDNPKVGTINCATMENCPISSGWVGLKQRQGGGSAPDGGHTWATSVQLTITAMTADSVKGSFQMQMAGPVAGATAQLAVTSGEFAVPHWKLK